MTGTIVEVLVGPVLFVDDEPTNRRLFRRLVHGNVVTAGTATEALEVLERRAFGAVICDLELGYGGDGISVLQVASRARPDALRWLTTFTPSSDPRVREGVAAGWVQRFVPKPWAPGAFADLFQR